MSGISVNSVGASNPVRQTQSSSPKPQSGAKPAATSGGSHGPAVVLGGALQGASSGPSGGQQAAAPRINHVI